MNYSDKQIQATAKSAELNGFCPPTLEQSVAFLDWYHSVKVPIKGEIHAIAIGLFGTLPNGYKQQQGKWAELGLASQAGQNTLGAGECDRI